MKSRARNAAAITLAMLAALAVAIFFRVYQIDRVPPPSLQVDEAFYGVDAIHVMQGQRAIFFEGNYGREPLFIYLAAGWMSLFGISPVTLRLLSGVIGTLTVLAMFWLGREVFWNADGPANGVGLAAAVFSAFLYINISFGRSAQRVITFPLFVALVMAALARCLRTRKTRDAVLTGVLLGLSLYTYSAIRVLPIAVALAFGLWWVWERDARFLVNGLLAAGIALVIFAPLGIYFLTHPDSFLFRASQVVASEGFDATALRTLRMFTVRGDKDLAINLPKRPLLDGIQAAIGLLGLAIGWLRRPCRAWVLTLLVLMVMLTPTVISKDAPAFGKSFGSVPPLLLLLGVGLATPLEYVWRWANNDMAHRRWAVVSLGLVATLAVIASMWITFRDYFQIYGQSGDLPYVFQANYTAMGNLIRTLPTDERVLISPFDEMPATLTFALHGDDPRVTLYDGRACVVLPDAHARAVSYLVILEDHNTLPALQLAAPDGHATNTLHFLLYQVPRGSTTQPSPQHALQAKWTEPVELLGYDIEQAANGVLPMVFYWRALGQIAEPYTAYVHLVKAGQAESKLMAQHDAPPCNASYVTQNWQVGDVIADHVSLQLQPDLPVGDYELRVGLYHTYLNTRLALASTDRPSQDNEIVVGTVHLGAAK